MDIRGLFNCNPNKFREAAKDKTYEEFITYLEQESDFKINDYFSEQEKKELYRLATIKY